MATITMVLSIIMIVVCLVMIVSVLLQKGAKDGMSGALTGGSMDTYYGRGGKRGIDAVMAKLTTVCGVLFVILALLLNIFA
ncbi:MAG: preprotein translocase subunit SecG [Butyricicoccaceae bacterium]